MTEYSAAGRSVITVTATSRPKRVAFLVDPRVATPADIEAITTHAVQHWGGGYYPIIPTDGSDLAADYWRLLKATDPDVVYPITKIDEGLAQRIALSIGPAAIEAFDERRQQGERLWIDSRYTSALGVLDIPRALVAFQRSVLPHRFLYLTSKGTNATRHSFALRNFGLTEDVVSTKHAFEHLQLESIAADSTGPGALLESLTAQHGYHLVTPRELSISFMSPPYRLKHDQFAEAFHLVVGDSTYDHLYAWNRQQLSARWKGQDFLWLPSSLIEDKAFLEIVGKWMAHVYWDNQQKHGFVVSYSQDDSTLTKVADIVGKAAWMPMRATRMRGDQFPLPEVEPYWQRPFDDPPAKTTQQIALHDDSGLVSIPVPRFVAQRHGVGSDGWMVDMDIEYHLDPARYAKKSDVWRLPKNAELGRDFVDSPGLARIVDSGMPSVQVTPLDQNVRLKIPSKRTVVMRLIQSANSPRSQRVCSVSAQGEKLAGLIDLVGSLDIAGGLFDDVYLREVLLGLAGSSDGHTRAQVGRVQNLLRKFSDSGESLADESKRADLAKRMVDKIAYFSEPIPAVSWDDMKRKFAEVKAKDKGQDALARDSFDEFRVSELEGLVEERVLVQGALLDCPHCGTKNWRVIGALSSETRCDGCLLSFPFSPTASWLFRLNELVSNGIEKAGILAVLHALHEIGRFARDFFLYLPCQDIYEDRGDGMYVQVTDLDLVVVKDGRFVIGEVKSSPEGFLDFNFERLRALAQNIRPELVILAATGATWPDPVKAQLTSLKAALAPASIEVEALLMDW
jgi:hypothetical protein